jgi:hypothetical protein
VTVGLQHALERSLDEHAPLSPEDLDLIRNWPLAHRLAVLALCGLWRRVPQSEWLAWATEYRTTRQGSLSEPFPPESLDAHDDVPGRNGVICEAMGVLRNTLSVWLCRCKPSLRTLKCVRELMDTP